MVNLCAIWLAAFSY